MALRKPAGPELNDEPSDTATPLPAASFASVVPLDGKWTPVTLVAAPPRETHSGTCICEACGAGRLSNLAIRFY